MFRSVKGCFNVNILVNVLMKYLPPYFPHNLWPLIRSFTCVKVFELINVNCLFLLDIQMFRQNNTINNMGYVCFYHSTSFAVVYRNLQSLWACHGDIGLLKIIIVFMCIAQYYILNKKVINGAQIKIYLGFSKIKTWSKLYTQGQKHTYIYVYMSSGPKRPLNILLVITIDFSFYL